MAQNNKAKKGEGDIQGGEDVKEKPKVEKVKGEEKKAPETIPGYPRQTDRHPVTCELTGAVFGSFQELKTYIASVAVPFWGYCLMVHDKLAMEREKVRELEQRIRELGE